MRIPQNFYKRFTRHQKDADDPEAIENMRIVNITLVRQSTLEIDRNLQKTEGAIEMNSSHLVDTLKCIKHGKQDETDYNLHGLGRTENEKGEKTQLRNI